MREALSEELNNFYGEGVEGFSEGRVLKEEAENVARKGCASVGCVDERSEENNRRAVRDVRNSAEHAKDRTYLRSHSHLDRRGTFS